MGDSSIAVTCVKRLFASERNMTAYEEKFTISDFSQLGLNYQALNNSAVFDRMVFSSMPFCRCLYPWDRQVNCSDFGVPRTLTILPQCTSLLNVSKLVIARVSAMTLVEPNTYYPFSEIFDILGSQLAQECNLKVCYSIRKQPLRGNKWYE